MEAIPKDFPNFTAKHVVEFLLTAVHVDCGCDCSTPRLTVSIVPCNLKKKNFMLIPSLVKCQEEVFILKTKTKTKNKNKEKNKKNPDRSPFLLKNHASYFLRNGHTVGRRLNLSHMNVICTFSLGCVSTDEYMKESRKN